MIWHPVLELLPGVYPLLEALQVGEQVDGCYVPCWQTVSHADPGAT
jgi:hypothetical protein